MQMALEWTTLLRMIPVCIQILSLACSVSTVSAGVFSENSSSDSLSLPDEPLSKSATIRGYKTAERVLEASEEISSSIQEDQEEPLQKAAGNGCQARSLSPAQNDNDVFDSTSSYCAKFLKHRVFLALYDNGFFFDGDDINIARYNSVRSSAWSKLSLTRLKMLPLAHIKFLGRRGVRFSDASLQRTSDDILKAMLLLEEKADSVDKKEILGKLDGQALKRIGMRDDLDILDLDFFQKLTIPWENWGSPLIARARKLGFFGEKGDDEQARASRDSSSVADSSISTNDDNAMVDEKVSKSDDQVGGSRDSSGVADNSIPKNGNVAMADEKLSESDDDDQVGASRDSSIPKSNDLAMVDEKLSESDNDNDDQGASRDNSGVADSSIPKNDDIAMADEKLSESDDQVGASRDSSSMTDSSIPKNNDIAMVDEKLSESADDDQVGASRDSSGVADSSILANDDNALADERSSESDNEKHVEDNSADDTLIDDEISEKDNALSVDGKASKNDDLETGDHDSAMISVKSAHAEPGTFQSPNALPELDSARLVANPPLLQPVLDLDGSFSSDNHELLSASESGSFASSQALSEDESTLTMPKEDDLTVEMDDSDATGQIASSSAQESLSENLLLPMSAEPTLADALVLETKTESSVDPEIEKISWTSSYSEDAQTLEPVEAATTNWRLMPNLRDELSHLSARPNRRARRSTLLRLKSLFKRKHLHLPRPNNHNLKWIKSSGSKEDGTTPTNRPIPSRSSKSYAKRTRYPAHPSRDERSHSPHAPNPTPDDSIPYHAKNPSANPKSVDITSGDNTKYICSWPILLVGLLSFSLFI